MIAAAMGGEVAAVKAKASKVVQPEAESESSEESSDEAPEPVKAPVKGKKQPVKKQAASEGDSEESDEDEEDSEDDEPAPLGKTAEEAESEESDSEEEPKPAKKGKVQKVLEPAKPAESDEESEGSDEEEAEPVVFIVGANKLGETSLKKFFKKKGIKVKAVTTLDKKTIAVDLIQASDVPKALALSGQDLSGQVLTIQSEAGPKKEAGKKDAKKAVKRPASDDDEEEDEEEEEDDDEDMEEEDIQAKRKKDKQSGNAAKKQKPNQSAAEEVFTAFIGGLKPESTDDTVKKFLKKKGIEVKDVRKLEGKRFGYVDLSSKEELQEVVALSGQSIDGEAIRVEEAKPKGSTPEKAGRQRDTSADERTLFVKNIPNSVDEDQLKEFFSEASEVRMPQKDGGHKGFAYVVFPDMDTADCVLLEKQGADLEGNALYLDRTGSKSSFTPSRGDDRRKSTGLRGESTVLFVKNLSYNVDEDALKEAFPDAVSARIARFADSGKHRGFGFVDFSSPAAASKAYDEKQNTEIDGREVVLDFSSPQGQGGGRGGFRGGRGGFGDRGRGGRGGRGGFRGGRGGYGDRGGRGGRGGFRGGRMGEPQGKKKRFNDSDSD